MNFIQSLAEHIRAGYQCLWVARDDEERLDTEIFMATASINQRRSKADADAGRPASNKPPHGVLTWDCAAGFKIPQHALLPMTQTTASLLRGEKYADQKYRTPTTALLEVVSDELFTGDWVMIFKDLDDFLKDPTLRRMLRTMIAKRELVNSVRNRSLVITTTSRDIHEKLRDCITLLEFPRPDAERLGMTFDETRASLARKHPEKAVCTDELREEIIQCMLGLTVVDAENALSQCIVRHGSLTRDMLSTIKEEKAAITKKSEVLTYIPESAQASRDEIGGFENLLEYIDRRKLAYSREAQAINLDLPRGVVLIGVPGSGKSMVATAVARLLGLPGYILDVSRVFGSLVGQSEERMRSALSQVEAQQGCVLLLDEADKAFGGAADSVGDSGVSRRIFGQLLTWLAMKNDRTFVIMTLNRTKGIPPEFLRAGRFDKIFYTDMPHEDEREAILKIHLQKRQVPPAQAGLSEGEWKTLVQKTKGFVGSEIEELVKEARSLAFQDRRSGTPTFDEFIAAAENIVPLSTVDAEGFTAIREFCKGRAIPVSSPPGAGRDTSPGTREISV